MLKAGAHFINHGDAATTENDLGWMTSVAWSPMLGHSIGLGFIRAGDQRMGETIRAVNPAMNSEIDVQIVSRHFYDPEGEHLRA